MSTNPENALFTAPLTAQYSVHLKTATDDRIQRGGPKWVLLDLRSITLGTQVRVAVLYLVRRYPEKWRSTFQIPLASAT